MKKKTWKRQIAIIAGLVMLCTGCGSNKSSDEYAMDNGGMYDSYAYLDSTEAAEELDSEYSAKNDAYYDDAVYEGVESDMSQSAGGADTGLSATPHTDGDATSTINKEMLVYRGELSIDTLDFNTFVSDFKAMINEKGGFVESESYSDSYSTNGYYAVDSKKKHNLYYATVRVPSSEYDAIMNAATTLGDVRSRYSDATNVTQQYSTYKSQLEIYEAEYERYLQLLESATEDEYALQIENELFDIQIQIAQLKSGITNIENDVAYSYIDITIKEVQEYEEAPEPTDTFWDRFKNTCKESWEGFLEFLEGALFFLIRNIYGIALIVVIVIVIRTVIKKKRAKRKAANQAEIQNPPMMNPVQANQMNPDSGQANMSPMQGETPDVGDKTDNKK